MPDFGSFRGFGEKLTQGQTPTQLGKIGSEAFGQDADYLAFYNRVITAGGTLSTLEQSATQQLVLDLKSYSIWTKMKAIYPMVGASAAACSQNLKSSSFTGTFNGGVTYANTGVTPNGTSGYMDTGFNTLSSLNINSHSLGIYSRTNNNNSYTPIGNSNFRIWLWGYFYGFLVSDNAASGPSWVDSSGFFQIIRKDSVNVSLCRNTITVNRTLNLSTLPNLNIYIGANNIGSPSNYTSNNLSFAYIGDGLSDTETSNFYTAVQAFQTTLSRQV